MKIYETQKLTNIVSKWKGYVRMTTDIGIICNSKLMIMFIKREGYGYI